MTSPENSYHSQLSSVGKLLAYLLLVTMKYFHWCFVSVKLTSWIAPWNSWPTSLSTQKQAALDDGEKKQWKWWGRKTRHCVSNTIWDFHLQSNRDGIKTKSPECQNVHSDDKRYVFCTWLMMTHLENIWKGKDKVMPHATYETATFTTCHPQISAQQEKNDPFSINAPSSSVTMALTRKPFIFSREIVPRWLLGTVQAWLLGPGLD